MKKTVGSLALCALLLASCKKDYICKCVNTSNGQVEGTNEIPIHATKSTAKKSCDKENASEGVLSKTCTLEDFS